MLKKIAASHQSQLSRTFLRTDLIDVAEVRELQRSLTSSLTKSSIKASKQAIAVASASVVDFAVRTFAASARRSGLDLKSMLAPKKQDRIDANRKSPGQIGKGLEKNFGVAFDDPYIRKQLDRFARDNAKMISGMTRDQVRRIADVTVEGISKGWTTKELGSAIAEVGDMTQRQARNIAADQAYKLNSNMIQAISDEAGVDDYEWIAIIDSRTRSLHIDLHQKVFQWSDDPPDDDGYPGEPPNCRCVPGPVFQ